MLYYDYTWDLRHDKIMLDEELDIDKIGWKLGDFFQLVNVDGRAQLERIDPLVAFALCESINERKQDGHS